MTLLDSPAGKLTAPESIETSEGESASSVEKGTTIGSSRRGFLGSMAGFATLGAVGVGGLLAAPRARAELVGPLIGNDRLIEAEARRLHLIDLMVNEGMPVQICNLDESNLPDLRGTFTKGLQHNFATGLAVQTNYAQLRHALETGVPADFEAISLAGSRPFVNPQAGLAFDTEGNDPHQFTMPPAPKFLSAEAATEMVELYWMALARDVPFTQYGSTMTTGAAASELTSLVPAGFDGPTIGGAVTAQSLFRDKLPGCLSGPYISQFMYLDTPFGAEQIDRRMRTVAANDNHVTNYNDWFQVQQGNVVSSQNFDNQRRYIRNGRDLAEWVHIDVLFQAYFNACLILGTPVSAGGLGAPLNPGNPYGSSLTQEGFGTWGGPGIKTLMCEVATRALKAVWFQKWFVHRRLRPETFGGHVHLVNSNPFASSILDPHPIILGATSVSNTFSLFGSYLLPQAFPEGSPMHPSYGAGHATVAGACVTILKALFDESYVLPRPYWVANPTGLGLEETSNRIAPLTVGGELNKLASNVSTGRNHAGVHYRSDGLQSLYLGEQVAIKLLRDHKTLFNEGGGYQFTDFTGNPIVI